MRPHSLAAALVILALVLPEVASAGDGVLEINQACAASGCFAGDAPGFPVTIDRDQTGSYRLTGNLVNLDPDVSTIRILDDHVTLDLNGFAVSGPTSCTGVGASLVCAPTGSGHGVEAFPPDAFTGIVVRNGIVRGAAESGVRLGYAARVEGVHAVANAGVGIFLQDYGLVTRCRVDRNGLGGVWTGFGSAIQGNVVFGNGLFGVVGIFIAGNVIRENASDIGVTGDGALVVDNAVTDNGGRLVMTSQGGYARNVFRRNGTGAQVTGGVEIGPNLCDTDTNCP